MRISVTPYVMVFTGGKIHQTYTSASETYEADSIDAFTNSHQTTSSVVNGEGKVISYSDFRVVQN